ncbi:ABC-three component system middle component 8 [Litoribacter populi]|uniref:ABC-three component system middle component 8 n=1 Tax=Litoribacter populi TaxID=2598460 RepID=UPI00117CDA48|nr:ABC-three component system middle component 8 [Litoribacter populi]
MIRPDRHTNLDYSVINISSFILGELSTYYTVSYDELLERVTKEIGENAKENFPYALNFLYLLGKIKYENSKDAFLYNEA